MSCSAGDASPQEAEPFPAWLGAAWGDAHQRCASPAPPAAPAVAVTPLAFQVKVKKHVQLVLERLLHTVNRRVIVLERENSLRVSTSALPGSGTTPRPLLAPGMEQRGAALPWARGNRQQVVFFSWCCGLWQQLAGDGFMGI